MNATTPSLPASARGSPLPHLLVWLATLMLVLLWSLLAWAAHALAGWQGWTAWAAGGTGGTEGWQAWIDALALPAWLAPWLPAQSLEAVKAMVGAAAPLIEWLAASMPALLSWLPGLVLAVWVAGTVLLLLGGALGSAAIGLWRRKLKPALARAH